MANMIMSKKNRPGEVCAFGCCDWHKPDVKKARRRLKRSERNRINRKVWMEWN